MKDDVLLAKAATIKRCIDRIHKVTERDMDILKSVVSNHLDDHLKWGAFCLNL
nr:hypothetical protein [uncultured Dethiosulfovibrio sp.]